jgi:signal transduction histidine kinase
MEQRTAIIPLPGAANGSPSDLELAFRDILAGAMRFCEADSGCLVLCGAAGFEAVSTLGAIPAYAESLRRASILTRPASALGRVAAERQTLHLPDLVADTAYLEREPASVAAVELEGARTALHVPMLQAGTLMGVVTLYRRARHPFADEHLALAQAFAGQAVIAIEKFRLLRDLQSRDQELPQVLEQQRVTGEILRVIASSLTDLGPVFETIVTNAVRLCEANFAFVMLNQGERLALAARTSCTPEFAEYLEKGISANRETTTGRAALERRPVQLLDFLNDPEVHVTTAHRIEGVRTVLAVPMLRDRTLIGIIVVWRREVRAFSAQQIKLLETFADQAVIAIENVRLFRELETRNQEVTEALERQTATGEVLRVISTSPTDVQPVFDMIAKNAVHLCDGQFSGVFRFDGEFVHLIAHQGLTTEGAEVYQKAFPRPPGRDSAIGRAILKRAIEHIPDVQADPEYGLSALAQAGTMRCIVAVPMLREGNPIGGIVVWRSRPDPFTDNEIKLVATFADQAVIAIENVRLFDEIQDKSRRLELANTYKSRFLAAASHDLRQPLHALNLFVAQLQSESDPGERNRIVARIDAAASAMNELFNALLDVSRLDAGVLELNLSEFPVEQLLERMEMTFAEAARGKGLRLHVVSSGAWVRSDFILLERILLNLVSNAVRYTARGGIVIGCRRRGERLRLEVWDSGVGIPEDQQQNIFDEFYQLAGPAPDRRGGLGLGLAIVDRLCRLLGHPVELASIPGKGSRFSVSVPLVAKRRGPAEASVLPATITDPVSGKLIVVIDDDALVLDGMSGILRSWGCRVVAAVSDTTALTLLAQIGQQPDLIISDYRLADGKSGMEAIESLRGAMGVAVPAFLISGDTAPERLRDAGASGYHLLHKPVPLMTLRAMANRLVKARDESGKTLPGTRR